MFKTENGEQGSFGDTFVEQENKNTGGLSRPASRTSGKLAKLVENDEDEVYKLHLISDPIRIGGPTNPKVTPKHPGIIVTPEGTNTIVVVMIIPEKAALPTTDIINTYDMTANQNQQRRLKIRTPTEALDGTYEKVVKAILKRGGYKNPGMVNANLAVYATISKDYQDIIAAAKEVAYAVSIKQQPLSSDVVTEISFKAAGPVTKDELSGVLNPTDFSLTAKRAIASDADSQNTETESTSLVVGGYIGDYVYIDSTIDPLTKVPIETVKMSSNITVNAAVSDGGVPTLEAAILAVGLTAASSASILGVWLHKARTAPEVSAIEKWCIPNLDPKLPALSELVSDAELIARLNAFVSPKSNFSIDTSYLCNPIVKSVLDGMLTRSTAVEYKGKFNDAVENIFGVRVPEHMSILENITTDFPVGTIDVEGTSLPGNRLGFGELLAMGEVKNAEDLIHSKLAINNNGEDRFLTWNKVIVSSGFSVDTYDIGGTITFTDEFIIWLTDQLREYPLSMDGISITVSDNPHVLYRQGAHVDNMIDTAQLSHGFAQAGGGQAHVSTGGVHHVANTFGHEL